MNFKTMKSLLLVGAVALAGTLPLNVNAANTANMAANLSTSSLITATVGIPMEFGTWLIGVPALAPASTLVINTAGVITPTAGTGVQLIQLSGTPTAGTVNVVLPTGADAVTLNMTHGVLGATLGAGLALSNITYANSDNVAQTGAMVVATPVSIDVDTGGTPAVVSFGGTITATATPTQGLHTTTFNVAFAY